MAWRQPPTPPVILQRVVRQNKVMMSIYRTKELQIFLESRGPDLPITMRGTKYYVVFSPRPIVDSAWKLNTAALNRMSQSVLSVRAFSAAIIVSL